MQKGHVSQTNKENLGRYSLFVPGNLCSLRQVIVESIVHSRLASGHCWASSCLSAAHQQPNQMERAPQRKRKNSLGFSSLKIEDKTADQSQTLARKKKKKVHMLLALLLSFIFLEIFFNKKLSGYVLMFNFLNNFVIEIESIR